MAVTKDRIVEGDSYHLSYSTVVRDANNRRNEKMPIEPIAVEIELRSVIDGVFIPLGDDGEQTVSIIPVGNRIDYVIDGSLLEVNGDYKAFVSAEFDIDGQPHRKTAIRSFKVLPKE